MNYALLIKVYSVVVNISYLVFIILASSVDAISRNVFLSTRVNEQEKLRYVPKAYFPRRKGSKRLYTLLLLIRKTSN